MSQKKTASYGSWRSPITADLIVADAVTFNQIALDGEDIYWNETRPSEAGRYVIVRRTPDGRQQDINPAPYNARNRVHEDGGGSFAVHQGTAYFSHYDDNRVYRTSANGETQALTPESTRRYADLQVDARHNRLICVVEDHSEAGQEASNYLAAVDLETGDVAEILAEGNDFYSDPRLNPDGDRLVWLTWNHPHLPWDGTELWTAEINEHGRLQRRTLVAGGERESIAQPKWSPDGRLYFVSDRNEWWNLYLWDGTAVRPVLEMEAEFASPQWIFGKSNYGFLSPQTVLAAYSQNGLWHLGMIDTESGTLREVDSPYTIYYFVNIANESLVCDAASASQPEAVVKYDLLADEWEVLKNSKAIKVDPGYLSTPEPVEFPTANGLTAHGLYYPPTNKDFSAPEGEKPPLIVIIHGGPTSATSSALNLKLQYWTSRGFAVFDVNYGGSTGYGRSYRERLYGQWGVVDVQDCANGAKYLVEKGLADPDRLIIRGGSAGGYTTAAALAFDDTFKAGADYFGLADLGPFAQTTHKFESRYLDQLIGPYPEMKDVYDERSPLQHARNISCPVIFFQGLDDKIVPPEQSEIMFEAVRARELPTAYMPFEGEGHGFRKAENIKRSLDGELYFYSKVFGFDVGEDVQPVEIENLEG